MSKVTSALDFSNIKGLDDLQRYLTPAVKDAIDTINGKISFTENIDAKIIGVTFPVANTNLSINHTLGRVPIGYIVVNRNINLNVYNGTIDWNKEQMTLKSSAAGNCNLLVF